MRKLTTAQIREMYLKFFEGKGCKRMPSSSLIPEDPSLLLTSAGMVQFKPYFLHVAEFDPNFVGATTVQKCVRTNDIENIGVTGRHLSFFEMLGNFSFGKYFKREMCAWAYEFSTSDEYLGLPADRLYFTVFEDDDETVEIWKSLGVVDSHISRLGEEDNFWRAGPTGPCGPCSEIYFDQGPHVGCGKPDCAPGCDCDRFLEYWNCVFTQFDGQADGTLKPLITKNIDTGMGLERMACIMQGVTNNYDTDVLRSLVGVGERLAGVEYKKHPATDKSLRIIADHARAVTFMISDGITPGNEGRGYVLRRLLRRAVMKGHTLGIKGAFLNEYVDEVVRLMGSAYPEIVENRETVRMIIDAEEARFGKTLAAGNQLLAEALEALKADSGKELAGSVAFQLHDTYGFPIELTQEICEDADVSVNMEEFEACMEEQRVRARAATKDDAAAAWSTYGSVFSEILKEVGETAFVGYETLEADTEVLACVCEGERVNKLSAGQSGHVILRQTPFYAEMGGEVGDTGCVISPGKTEEEAAAFVKVTDTKTPEAGLIAHSVTVNRGEICTGDKVHAKVDEMRRHLIERNHTATHLLHAALREVLGDHVAQKGSYVSEARLRFDFTHFHALTAEEIAQVETLANKYVLANISTNIYETSLDEARASGVTALFGEKYGSVVRVVEVNDFSRELCGGCHVKNTSEIGSIKIVAETSVSSGVRRIEALTSAGVLDYLNKVETQLKQTAKLLRAPTSEVAQKVEALQAALKEARTQAQKKAQSASDDELAALSIEKAKAGYNLVIANIGEATSNNMRDAWDALRHNMKESGAVVLAGTNGDKVLLLAAGTPDAVQAGFHAGNIIKQISPLVGGGGGGKPTLAQAGGKDKGGIDAALESARDMLI